MKFGIFFELSVPRPWTRDSERIVYENALEQAALADELGFNYAWAVEHHFLEEYSHCSAPELFLTAVAMRTKRLHVGHGIVVCVPEFNHPIKIAEKTAVLDILSGGRLEVGTGRSATWCELGGFRANPDETKKTWDEFVHCLPKMWTQERFSYQGRSWSMPERAILPKPYQKPHPRMWVAVTTPGTEIDAADRGMGALGISYDSIAVQEKTLHEYRRHIKNCEPVGEIINDHCSALTFLYCHEDDEQGIKLGSQMFTHFSYLAAQIVMNREAYPTKSYPSVGLLPALRSSASGPSDSARVPQGVGIGNPERILKTMKEWESAGFDSVNFLCNAVEMLPQEAVLNSLRLFGKYVLPHFKDDKPATETVSREGLAAAGAR
jgi:alkanesulfonate monooxygenase SsuD/methylene tetrahydromethanopterin reductase-like flavin-dependent oxidoreductase (luciferase family)